MKLWGARSAYQTRLTRLEHVLLPHMEQLPEGQKSFGDYWIELSSIGFAFLVGAHGN